MNLVIVESPTKTKTISRFLDKNYRILATMGHIRDLPKKKLGVDIENDFKPEYVQVPGRKETIKKLNSAAKTAQKIYLATDLDREGEAIAYHVAYSLSGSKSKNFDSQLQAPNSKFLRITFHEITPAALKKALTSPARVNMQLVHAQQARRILDRLVGYKLSPLLWRKVRQGLSAGRVQSVAVRLIVEREREIEKFISEEYWDIFCRFRKKIGRKRPDLPSFSAKLAKKNGQAVKLTNKQEAEEAVNELQKAGFEVEKVLQKELKRNPAPPFITSTLQRTAFARLGYSSKQTMRLAQSLYEKGFITYHRTDSVSLAAEALAKIRHFIEKKYSTEYLPSRPRFYKTRSKLAQEAHEAIRPTGFDFQKAPPLKSEREKKLYELIFNRAIASQMKTAVFDSTKVSIRGEGEKNLYSLLTEGKVIKFPGWLVVYNENSKLEDQEPSLPQLVAGNELALIKISPEQKFTQPPPRYNEASLIKALEQRGIGRPSTYAPTISTIQERQYVEKIEKKLKPTSLGTAVNDFLMEYFAEILDYDFTAQMEGNLDAIALGKKKWSKIIKDFYQPFNQKLETVTQIAERVKVPVEVIGKKCPQCQTAMPADRQGELVIRVGRFGKFISCSRFPDCDYTERYIEKVEGVKCPECSGEIIVKKTKKGKQFYGCANYPKCKWASWRRPK